MKGCRFALNYISLVTYPFRNCFPLCCSRRRNRAGSNPECRRSILAIRGGGSCW